MENDVCISARNVTKSFKIFYDKANSIKDNLLFWNRNRFKERVVLKDVSLDVGKGESVALIGVNGSGKSTLLKLMTKIIYPTHGSVETFGRLTSLLELGAGFHSDFTGLENIYFNSSIFGLTKKQIDSRLKTIIDFSELQDIIHNPVRTYSSGQYMRLAFSIAINVDADIILIDEILSVGDMHFQKKCFEKLIELRNHGKTIVIVSHSLGSLRNFCDRGVWIQDGHIVMDDEVNKVIDEYIKKSRS